MREFGLSMTAYVLLLPAVMWLLPKLGDSPWRFALMLVPAIPMGLAVAAFVRFLLRMDEMHQRIHLASLAFASGSVGLLSFTYGLLEVAGLPHLSWVFIFPAIILLWGLGTLIANRRYQ